MSTRIRMSPKLALRHARLGLLDADKRVRQVPNPRYGTNPDLSTDPALARLADLTHRADAMTSRADWQAALDALYNPPTKRRRKSAP